MAILFAIMTKSFVMLAWLQQVVSLKMYPVDTERKLNAHKTLNLRPVSTG